MLQPSSCNAEHSYAAVQQQQLELIVSKQGSKSKNCRCLVDALMGCMGKVFVREIRLYLFLQQGCIDFIDIYQTSTGVYTKKALIRPMSIPKLVKLLPCLYWNDKMRGHTIYTKRQKKVTHQNGTSVLTLVVQDHRTHSTPQDQGPYDTH